MKTALIKYPYKLQDLVILDTLRRQENDNIDLIPIDFSDSDLDLASYNIILGLGKGKSKVFSFKMSDCRSTNDRDLEYLNYLRFKSDQALPSAEVILLKKSISDSRLGLLNLQDKNKEINAYSSLDILSMIDASTGMGTKSEELITKLEIFNSWSSELARKAGKGFKYNKVGDNLLENQIVSALNRDHISEGMYESYADLMEDLNNRSDYSKLTASESQYLKSQLENLFSNNEKDSNRLNTNILNILDIDNYRGLIDLWVTSLFNRVYQRQKNTDLWNSCDFSLEGVVINRTGESINNWKQLSKSEGDVLYFVTPEPSTENWSILSVNPSKNPLVESDLYYWIHVSKFLAKFTTWDKTERYIMYLLSEGSKEGSDDSGYSLESFSMD